MQISPRTPVSLWPNCVPGALGSRDRDTPALTPYFADPAKATGAAMVVCPGGGYEKLAEHEGAGYAEWLAGNGIAAFVLTYRLGSDGYRHPSMLDDAARALRLVRAHAAVWNLNAQRVGIIGSSAGGHLAATLLTHFDAGHTAASDPIERESSRPDFGILCYPVISMGPNTHEGSRKNLLGDNPPVELVALLSNEKQVTLQTPPCFIWHTWEDPVVKVDNSLAFAEALQRAGVPFEAHIYEKGGHGMGLGPVENRHRWATDCIAWLRERGIAH